MDSKKTATSLQCVWFRSDLRTIDNPALSAAINNNQPTIAIFIFSEEQWKHHHRADIQIDLIKRRVIELKKELHDLHIPLIFLSVPWFADIPNQLQPLCQSLSISHLFANKEFEVNEMQRDEAVNKTLADVQCDFYQAKCLLSPGSVLNRTNQPYKVFTPFSKAWRTQFYQTDPSIQKVTSSVPIDPKWLTKIEGFSDNQPIQALTQESRAWSVSNRDIIRQLRQFCENKVNHYEMKRDHPAVDGTSQLSPYLAIGALSPKQCVLRLHLASNNQLTKGGETWLNELIWREFYTHLLHFYPNLSKHAPFHSFEKQITWHNDHTHFQRWCEGETGYPIVDAAMKQLNRTGWMHNRLRMITASFLVKDLHIDWRWGERYFMSKLIDGDFAANNGGWQWCASTGCDSVPYFRIFNPTTQSQRFDANGEFIASWLPALSSLSSKERHKPTQPELVNYPAPIVDHAIQRTTVIEQYKQAKKTVEE